MNKKYSGKRYFFEISLYVIAQVSLVLVSIYFIIKERFPIKRFIFDFVLLGLIALLLFFITKKKYTSLFFASSLTSLIIFASNLKQSAIGSYLYFSDFIFFLKNPLFVLDFVSIPLVIFACLIWTIYFILLFTYEKKSYLHPLHFIALFILLGSSFHQMKIFSNQDGFRARSETKSLQTFIQSFYIDNIRVLPVEDNNPACCQTVKSQDIAISAPKNAEKKNIVFILLESTFNLNSLPGLNLPNQWAAFNSVPLLVHTAGGATWTAEYAVLHGVNPTIYGSDFPRINIWGPGTLAGRIAPSLKEIGYKTYSVPPHNEIFANTKNFHMSLGIDNIHDCHAYSACPKDRVKRDTELFEHIFQILSKETNPAFVFSWTINQHSPHKLSMPNSIIKCDNFTQEECNALQEYKNREIILQAQIQQFVKKLDSLKRKTTVIFFGDHVPESLSRIEETKFRDNSKFTTIAFGYSTQEKRFFDLREIVGKCNQDFKLSVEDLDVIPLAMNHMQSRYISYKYENLKKLCKS